MPSPGVIGRDHRRLDAPAKLTGRTRYAADLRLPGTAHVRLLLSPYASARIRSVNLEAARALPGVVSVVSGEDLPEVPARGPEAPLARERVYFAGHPVVAALAEPIGQLPGLPSIDQAADEFSIQFVEVASPFGPSAPRESRSLLPCRGRPRWRTR